MKMIRIITEEVLPIKKMDNDIYAVVIDRIINHGGNLTNIVRVKKIEINGKTFFVNLNDYNLLMNMEG